MILNWERATFTDPTNYGEAFPNSPIFVVLHGSGLPADATSDGELAYLQRSNLKVSYHLYVRKDGRVRQLVPLSNVAYHAGESTWTEGETTWNRLNAYSIGIALETHNLGEPYPPEQEAACRALTELMMAIYEIPKARVLTHRMISYPRKQDPVNWNHEAFVQQIREEV